MTGATVAQVILVMLLWAGCFPLITIGIEYAPHLTFAALRAFLAGAVLIAVAVALRRSFPKSGRLWAAITIIGFSSTGLGFLGMFHAAEFVSPGVATVIANTQPLLAAILANIVLNEKLVAQSKAGLSLGFVGILIIAMPQVLSEGHQSYILGIAYIFLAALGITISNVLIKKITPDVDALTAMGLQILIGSSPLIFGAWIMEEPASVRWSYEFVGALLGLSLLGTALVYWLWFSILERTPLNQANCFSFLIPIFGLTMGMLFYGESLHWVQLVGIALTVLGVGLVTRGSTRPLTTDE